MKSLVVEKIKKSIDLMDEFENGEYDYLELKDWFWVKDLENRRMKFDDNTGTLSISLLVVKNRDKNRVLCKYEPTMTELRQMQHHGLSLDKEYEKDSFDDIIRNGCKTWKQDVEIKLPIQICLRAQTSWNRIDYGCEWLGGGDWEEKTLYGETTNFYIDSVILRERYKTPVQEAREILNELQNRYDENVEFIDKVMVAFKYIEQYVIHKSFGEGHICDICEDKIRVQFDEECKLFKCPDSILQGYFRIPEHNNVIQAAIDKWNENQRLSKKIKIFEYAQGDLLACLEAVRNYKKENM